jgi:hypothetical protein
MMMMAVMVVVVGRTIGFSGSRVRYRHDHRNRETRHCHPLDEGTAAQARTALRVTDLLIAHLNTLSGPRDMMRSPAGPERPQSWRSWLDAHIRFLCPHPGEGITSRP